MKRNNTFEKIKMVASVAFIASIFTSCIFLPPSHDETGNENMTLVWSDEFEGTKLNLKNWAYETGKTGWGNNEEQNYVTSAANSTVSNGTLKINAIKTSSGWTSARLVTKGKHSWKYGYMEARIKLPEGTSGIWPAFWMMPEDSVYGTWPRSGELDIMEYSPATSGEATFATVHHSSSASNAGTDKYDGLGRAVISTRSSEFHTYALKWTESYVEAFYDGKSLGTKYVNDGRGYVNWPYDQNFFIILNLAMGGNLGGAIPSNMTKATFEIDYVRVYQ